MRILQLVTVRQWRGAEVFATQLSDALAGRGHTVLVAGLLPPGADPLAPKVALAEDLRVVSGGRFDARRLAALVSLIRRFQPDVIQANGSQTLKYSSVASRLLGRRTPLLYRNISIASWWLRSPLHRRWGRWLAGALDHVSSVSLESSEDFGTTYGIPAERRSISRGGVVVPETVASEAARRTLLELTGAPAHAGLLAHIGSYSEEKNHAWLVEAFARIHRERGDAHLALIGDGPLRPAVEAQIHRLGLGGSIHVLGLRKDAAQLVAGADLFVLPSRIEGIPGVVLEAAAQAVPAVVTDVGGMREAVQSGTNGYLVPLDDRDAFVGRVLELLADEARRREMGTAARERVQAHFSMDTTAAGFEELYEELACEKRR
jgi:L-malate glycosyltransferase